MIDVKDLRDNPEKYRNAAVAKRMNVDVAAVIDLEQRAVAAQQEFERLRAEQNEASKQIGRLKDPAAKQEAIAKVGALKTQVKEAEERWKLAELQVQPLLLALPQPADDDVPVGKDDSENVEIKKWGEPRKFEFDAKDHVTLGQKLGIIDIERGVKLAGSRSYFLVGDGALLQQAVLRLAQDMMLARGFVPLFVPVLVREEPMTGTGYFPLGRDQAYEMTNEDPPKYLVGTSEVSLTAFHMNETLELKSLPRKYIGMSPCFRREAGTYGKDTAGLYRIHQFDKVEQVIICRNDREESKRWHQEILQNAEDVLQKLNLAYRVVKVCTGDLGQGQAAKFDIETWMPSRKSYGETHSASRFYDFQARRLNLRYRDEHGKVQYCHTLNNTVIATPRVLIPIIENYQNPDGSVMIPDALRPYMGNRDKIERNE
jgi:seryl-tRNA synthetase